MAVLIDIDMPEECGKCCFLNAKCFLKGRNPFNDTMDISRGRPYWCPLREVVRCKDCKWFDPPHIEHPDGTRTDVEEGAPMVTISVGINCGGQCIHHTGIKTYCTNHDREDPDDYENIVIFRSPDDFCSMGERREE